MGSNSASTRGGRKRKMRLTMIRNRKAMEKKLKQLKRLIPGGNEVENAETLFQKTANYIFLLEWQVSALRTISSLSGVLGRNSEDSSVDHSKDLK
ncbi:hypothetical protein RHSIM_Rhsim01G0012500 [Rhododendron simsii]|uniref:Uncharacterized protein n=1 Tax=Rhododendron simsii TaxID=118357 RepID=A0A834HL56_RHOSS|nr:hypothetical protein RHSIM_Rhsim01G0012500 [Rhododendron simsii]